MRSRLPATIRNAAVWARRFARTAPGVITAVGAVLVILALVSGLLCVNQLNTKISRRDTVLAHTEPLADAAQRLYVALSSADAAASTAFLSGGVESPVVHGRYEQALADAAGALAEATAGATDSGTRLVLAQISAELPTYTGLVEAARANNRQNLPVGSAYLRQASTLMQGSLLKNAEALENTRFGQLHDDQETISAVPLWSVVALVLLLAACGYGSWLLLRRTNRWINPGVLAAAGAAVLALLWIGATTLAATAAVDDGSGGATARFETLSRVRILAQQARTEETLQLITRGDINASEDRFNATSSQLRAQLQSATGTDSDAAKAFSKWQDGHHIEVAAYLSNDYRGAVTQAIGGDPASSATLFTALDTALQQDLQHTRQQVRDGVNDAGNALLLSPWGTLVLLFAAGGAVGAGLWPRLKEFL
ncbi:hypothetical protein [Nocardia sp. NPDC020380]|uniref:hypothetical protein n=1 Tax=Nocardia sp. NPDC020380 TaxID=3364309 RepID=UPI0037B39C80